MIEYGVEARFKPSYANRKDNFAAPGVAGTTKVKVKLGRGERSEPVSQEKQQAELL